MRFALITQKPGSYSTRRTLEACRQRGHEARILDANKLSIYVEERAPSLRYGGKPLRKYDAVIPRIGASSSVHAIAAVRQFEQMGIFSLNSSHALSISRDKLRSLQTLSRHDIGLPPSAFVRSTDEILPAIERLGGAPVIIKLLEGTQGLGVILAESEKGAETIIETLQVARQNVLIQKFVAESKGRDIRAFVIGDKVVAAMRRRAQGQEFRSNVHRGGTTEPVVLDEEYERTAVRAAHILGLNVAGVDMLESDLGPKVMEVNSSPGLEGIEAATGIDIAAAIIAFLEEQIYFPDVDLRQKLTLGKGYEIAEIPVAADSGLCGRTLGEAGLREQEIIVLSISRNNALFPAPQNHETIVQGDVLLCYGKRMTLKSLVPPRKEKKRRRKDSGAVRSEGVQTS